MTPREPQHAVRHRVRIAQDAARDGLILAGLFLVAALVTVVTTGSLGRWLPLHLFLAGALVAAISGASVLFAVTWSAGPAPPRRATRTQLALVGAGAAGVAVVRTADATSAWIVAPAVAFTAGLAVLAAALTYTVHRGSQRRFDVTAAWYVAALLSGITGTALGVAMALGESPTGGRSAHVALNVLGLVGLVIGGTLPTFAATLSRSRMAPGATPGRRFALLVWQLAAVVATASGALAGLETIESLGLSAYAIGIALLAMLLPAPTGRQIRWAGPRLLGMHASLLWWCGATAAAAARAAGGHEPTAGRLVIVLVLAGFGQLVWASAAYLVPVIRAGGHELLSAGFARTRSWTALAAFNVSGVLAAMGATTPAVAAVTLAVADTLLRQGPMMRRGGP